MPSRQLTEKGIRQRAGRGTAPPAPPAFTTWASAADLGNPTHSTSTQPRDRCASLILRCAEPACPPEPQGALPYSTQHEALPTSRLYYLTSAREEPGQPAWAALPCRSCQIPGTHPPVSSIAPGQHDDRHIRLVTERALDDPYVMSDSHSTCVCTSKHHPAPRPASPLCRRAQERLCTRKAKGRCWKRQKGEQPALRVGTPAPAEGAGRL